MRGIAAVMMMAVCTCAGERTSVTGRHRSLSTTTTLTLSSDSTKSTRDPTTLGLVTATTSCQQYAPCLTLTTKNKKSSGDEIANVNFFTQCARKLPEMAEITQNNAITPFKVTQSHRLWYQSKAHLRFPISD